MKSALLPGGKGASGEKDGGLRSFVKGRRKEIFSYKPHLLRLLGSGGNGLAGCGEGKHEWRLRLKLTIPTVASSLRRARALRGGRPSASGMNNAENLDVVMADAVEDDERSPGNYKFASIFNAPLPASPRKASQHLDACKNSVDQGIRGGGTFFVSNSFTSSGLAWPLDAFMT